MFKKVKPKDIQRIISSTDAQSASIEILQLFTQSQAERMYSEEDVARAFNEGSAKSTMGDYIRGEEWVKTHKKDWY
jgi:hypothetical protein